jgi:hypothetical protein
MKHLIIKLSHIRFLLIYVCSSLHTDSINGQSSAGSEKNSTTQLLLNINRPLNDCNSLFDKCLCSFNDHTNRNFLYCNDHALGTMPDFKSVYTSFDTQIKPDHPNLNLVFSKVDLKGSSIRQIRKDDLSCLQIDLLPNNLKQTLAKNSTKIKSTDSSSFDSLLDKLKHSFTPSYHLDFDSIVEIDDGAFQSFVNNSVRLTYELADIATNKNRNGTFVKDEEIELVQSRNENLLKIRFSDSRFDFAPTRRPFQGLRALELHFNNITNEYLANSIFDESVVSEIYLENSPNFVGFIDASSTLPNGKLLHRFVVIKSYKIGKNLINSQILLTFYALKYRVFYSFSRTLKSYKKIIYDRLVTVDSLF